MIHIKVLLISALIFLSSVAFGQRGNYNAANNALIRIFGSSKNYEYGTRNFAGRYNLDNKRFEFYLPITSVYATADTSDLYLFQDLFATYGNDRDFFITATFPDQLTTLSDFRTPQDLILDGTLTLPQNSLHLPVYMKLFYSNNTLFYSLRVDFDLDMFTADIPAHYVQLLSGPMQLLVAEGKWSDGRALK